MDVWTLCDETFGRIPANWRHRLEAMEAHHGPEELQEAFRGAKQHGARRLEYVEAILSELRARRRAEPSAPDGSVRLVCEGCGLPSRVDNMVVRAGKGLCRGCAGSRPGGGEDPYPEEAERYRGHPVVHVLPETLEAPCSDCSRLVHADDCPENVVAPLGRARTHPETLLWWLKQPSCWSVPGNVALAQEALRDLGIEPPDPPVPAAGKVSGVAKKVGRYWQAVAG